MLHFAGSAVVPESVSDPLAYYRNNLSAGIELIRACLAGGVKRFIFSSTAAVYGEPEEVPVPESAPPRPVTSAVSRGSLPSGRVHRKGERAGSR